MARQYPSFVPGWTNSDKFDTSSGRIDRMNTLEEINSLEEQIQQLITRKNELIDRAEFMDHLGDAGVNGAGALVDL